MNVLLVILLSLTYWSFTPIAHAAAPGAGSMQAQKDAEAKGFRFDGNREELVAKAKKEGALRALLGFDKPTIVALRDGFRKKYPFINPQFEEAMPFKEDMAHVRLGRRWGYIDRNGKFVINPQFDEAAPFESGLARVKLSRRTGYIDHSGHYVWNPAN